MLPFAPGLRLLFGTVASIIGATVVLAWRVRETRHPVSTRAIIIPPIGMSTGFAMFVVPQMRVPFTWGLGAFLAGALIFSLPLTWTTHLERQGEDVMVRRSPVFLVVLIVLAGLRFGLRDWLDHIISPLETAALFYLLAFGMIVVWRARMLIAYRRLTQGVQTAP